MKGRIARRLAVTLSVAALAGMLSAVPASAAPLTNVAWSVSNNATSATSVFYTFSFTTATTGTVATVTFSVPAGTAGTPAVSMNYGISAGTAALAANVITYTVTAPASISAGTPILIEFSGLVNTATAGSYASAFETKTAVPATIDTGTSPSVPFGQSNTAITVVVAKSLTFTNDTSAFTLLMDPALPALANQTRDVALTVKTNASDGYTLGVRDLVNGLYDGVSDTIADVTGTIAAPAVWPGASRFGFSAVVTGATAGGGMGVITNFAAYPGVTPVTVASRATPTGNTADTISLRNRVEIDYTQDAGVYTDTVTYTVTPSY